MITIKVTDPDTLQTIQQPTFENYMSPEQESRVIEELQRDFPTCGIEVTYD